MRHIIFILTTLLAFISCDQINSDKKLLTETKNKKLIGFKTLFLAEHGDHKYEDLEKELNKKNVEIKYINDIIYVSYLDELNACGQYDGNIEINGDTIKLIVDLISDEVCASTSIEKITFLIDNPNGEKKIIKKQ